MKISDNEIDSMLFEYYRNYYEETLGLPEADLYIEKRIKEDETYFKTIDRYKHLIPFFYLPKYNKKVLIDGAGTGQEFISFFKMGYNTYGIEPNEDAVKIIKLKCEKYKIDTNNILNGFAESLPYADNFFDLVWSWTVLEHVQDYKKAISEIYRVLKPGGWAFLMMPDYRQFYEPHYKLYLPMIFPRWILKFLLRINKRPVKFLDNGINYINTKKIRQVLQEHKFDSMLMVHHWPEQWKYHKTMKMTMVYLIYKHFGIPRDQTWLVYKRFD